MVIPWLNKVTATLLNYNFMFSDEVCLPLLVGFLFKLLCYLLTKNLKFCLGNLALEKLKFVWKVSMRKMLLRKVAIEKLLKNIASYLIIDLFHFSPLQSNNQ